MKDDDRLAKNRAQVDEEAEPTVITTVQVTVQRYSVKAFGEFNGSEAAFPQRKGRLEDKYGVFNPLDVCLECFRLVSDAETYVENLMNRGKEGYSIRLMRASEPLPEQVIEEPVSLKWFPEVDEEGRDVYYRPYNSRKLHEDLPVNMSYADIDLLCSPYSSR
jgi:hypothetical protein